MRLHTSTSPVKLHVDCVNISDGSETYQVVSKHSSLQLRFDENVTEAALVEILYHRRHMQAHHRKGYTDSAITSALQHLAALLRFPKKLDKEAQPWKPFGWMHGAASVKYPTSKELQEDMQLYRYETQQDSRVRSFKVYRVIVAGVPVPFLEQQVSAAEIIAKYYKVIGAQPMLGAYLYSVSEHAPGTVFKLTKDKLLEFGLGVRCAPFSYSFSIEPNDPQRTQEGYSPKIKVLLLQEQLLKERDKDFEPVTTAKAEYDSFGYYSSAHPVLHAFTIDGNPITSYRPILRVQQIIDLLEHKDVLLRKEQFLFDNVCAPHAVFDRDDKIDITKHTQLYIAAPERDRPRLNDPVKW